MSTLVSVHHRSTRVREAVGGPRKPVVLVVEDHEFAREAVAALLSSMGYDVVEAENGRHAPAAMAQGAHPDVFLPDLMIAVIDRWEVMKQQRRDLRLCTDATIGVTRVASPH